VSGGEGTATVRVVEPDTEPNEALMSEVPPALAPLGTVASPVGSMVAFAGVPEVQVTPLESGAVLPSE
jgi:hypothetical protein